jgi:hypothetical protein
MERRGESNRRPALAISYELLEKKRTPDGSRFFADSARCSRSNLFRSTP